MSGPPLAKGPLTWTVEIECYPAARCSRAPARLGRPSAAEILHVTNFAGLMRGLREVVSWTCGGVCMNS